MGGLVIERIRSGVEFVPDAASAFRRAEAQVQHEFGRNIDVNSTYRSWSYQMSMYNAWNSYVNGSGPRPAHSKAIHPQYSRHVHGLALDSDDWVNARIVQILAENGFIRNQLHVPGEQHHFEYIRARDKNYGKEIDMSLSSEDVKRVAAEVVRQLSSSGLGNRVKAIYESVRFGKKGVRTHGNLTGAIMSEIGAQKIFRAHNGGDAEIDVKALAIELAPLLNEQESADLVKQLLAAQGKAYTDAAG